MDYYKKKIKTKDVSSILNEKEYKCASLQAITSEAIKEDNQKRLKDLIEEINEHLTDLRIFGDDAKHQERCEKLINEYQKCLVKLVNRNSSESLLAALNKKYNDLEELSHKALKENDSDTLKELVGRIKRNLEVLKELPEVKDTTNREKCEEFGKLVKKYKDLLMRILSPVYLENKLEDKPVSSQIFQKKIQGEQGNDPPKANKVALNEVEEKLRVMRQKRLNRLSTFVNEQSKLSEQRSRDNSPKNSDYPAKTNDNIENSPRTVGIETVIKSFQSPDIVKLPLKSIGEEKAPKTIEPKVFMKNDEKAVEKTDEKLQRSSSELSKENSGKMTDIRRSFGKNGLLSGFLDKGIGNAKEEASVEQAKLQLRTSSSGKTAIPPRTPTQIRKIFNSFNACVTRPNLNKSIEDLPNEYKSQFEKELKTSSLKPTGFASRLEKFKEKEEIREIITVETTRDDGALNGMTNNKERSIIKIVHPPSPVRKDLRKAKLFSSNEFSDILTSISVENEDAKNEKFLGPKSSLSVAPTLQKIENDPDASLNDESSFLHPEDFEIVAVQRDKNENFPLKSESNRCSFSTFRSSSDSLKDLRLSFDNPSYEVVEIKRSTEESNKKRERGSIEKLVKDVLNNCSSLEDVLKRMSSEDMVKVEEYNKDINQLNNLLKDVKKNVEKKLLCDENFLEINKFVKVSEELGVIEENIICFKGLKRDVKYLELDSRLAKLYVDADHISRVSRQGEMEFDRLVKRMNDVSKLLEDRVTRNENILREIFVEQVNEIGAKYL